MLILVSPSTFILLDYGVNIPNIGIKGLYINGIKLIDDLNSDKGLNY